MTLTYPKSEKPSPYPQPVLAPTAKLQAEAALGEAIMAFNGMARSAGMIGVFLISTLSSSLSGLDAYFVTVFLPVTLSLLAISLSLSFAATDFTPASRRAKYFSGVDEDQRRPSLWGWVRWAAFVGSFVFALGILFNRKAMGLPVGGASALAGTILIIGQLTAILMDMLRGVKLLRFAQAQLASDGEVAS